MISSGNFHGFVESLPPAMSREIERASELVELAVGQSACHQDDPSDGVFVIESGVVEVYLSHPNGSVLRTLTYLCKGDFFGETGVLTEKPRSACVRACEPSVLRKIPSDSFVKLLAKVPALGQFISVRLALRLQQLTSSQFIQSYCSDLSGNMHNFDLLIVFQTITSSARTGEFRLLSNSGDLQGSFFFENGNVVSARFAHLEGLEAVWQLFLEENLEGTFVFQILDQPTLEFAPEHRITIDGTDLLMQAASKRDIFQSFAASSRNLERRLSKVANELTWTDPGTLPAARLIWQHIQKRPQTIGTLWRLSNLSMITVIEVIRQLRDTAQAALETSAE